jgi:hypothetical protein
LVFRCEPTLFYNYRLLAGDCTVATSSRVIAPSHPALYQRHGVIIGTPVALREYGRKCRRDFLDFTEEPILARARSRIDGRDRCYFSLGRKRIVGKLSKGRIIHVERFVHSQERGFGRRIHFRQTRSVRLKGFSLTLREATGQR